ncbi:MAG: 5'-methylthioadenosine/S-adenosylhomocysteine nucleosidase family protein [Anaerolineales bacterium]
MRELLPDMEIRQTPYGECFRHDLTPSKREIKMMVMHGGWGKIAAAASTQYAIDRWRPELLVNLGTCGGFEGKIKRGEVLLVEKTLVYDIYEQMGDPGSHIDHYATKIDLSWLNEPYPFQVRRGLLVSGDRDLAPDEIGDLESKYGAIAGDWESGSISFVANRNHVPLLILRAVSDLVSEQGGEVYGDQGMFEEAAARVMEQLIRCLPQWLAATRFFS